MEVVMLEYSLNGFTPVIIAAVTAAGHQTVYGNEPAFQYPATTCSRSGTSVYPPGGCVDRIDGKWLHSADGAYATKIKSRAQWRLVGAGLLTRNSGARSAPKLWVLDMTPLQVAIQGEFPAILMLTIA